MNYLQNGIEVRYFDKEERSACVSIVDYQNIDNNSFIIAINGRLLETSNKTPRHSHFLEWTSHCFSGTEIAFTRRNRCVGSLPSNKKLYKRNSINVHLQLHLRNERSAYKQSRNYYFRRRPLYGMETVDGGYENTQFAQFDTFFEGMFRKERLLDLIKNFLCFSNEGLKSYKILAGYHQYFAVRKAISSTKKATVTDGKGGVFWHTQGSGKSLSMVFYAHLLQEALDSPTIVVITDRNDLDDQLYGQFAKCKDFLRQVPVQAGSRAHLKELLAGRKANGIFFTTMQKFEESDEPLSTRRNIIVMADEAHRGQYGLSEKD